jgi:lipopolysaccharide export system permease protein
VHGREPAGADRRASAQARPRRRLSGTLSGYIARQNAIWFAVLLFAISGIVLSAGIADRADRLAGDEVGFSTVVAVALLRVPMLVQEVMPFVVLGAAMFTFWRLTRTNELVVARAAGVSVWQFLLPPVAIAALVGVLAMTLLSPMSAAMLARATQIEQSVSGKSGELSLSLRGGGLWLQQVEGDTRYLLHAESAEEATMTLFDVIVFRIDNDRFEQRIDAATATLNAGFWVLRDATISTAGEVSTPRESVRIPTDLTRRKLLEGFAPAETLSFWQLPEFIALLEQTGFTTREHRLEFHKLLALPLMFTAMVVLAASFSLRPQRAGRVGLVILVGVLSGFLLFFLSNLVSAIGLSGKVPPAVAAWTPAAVALALSLPLLLHLEDG